MTTRTVQVRPDVAIGGGAPFALIAGPCVIEDIALCRTVCRTAKDACDALGIPYIFKASFDKANRTSVGSFRGQGLVDGLSILREIRDTFGVPVLTDVHEPAHCTAAAAFVDILQIPAFLCRQTDLLLAAGDSGAVVNVKKGQFLAPWDIAHAVRKVESTGNDRVLVTERGVSFGYNTLVVDYRSLPQMAETTGVPVVFDATHAVQQPGGRGDATGGQREFVAPLARAAVAVGIDGLFLEVHPDPSKALSDAATMLPLDQLPELLATLKRIESAVHA
ncbi:MAG: 3-deoxy-8-phosphooctulonate synthase [Armatimonadota bacterium]